MKVEIFASRRFLLRRLDLSAARENDQESGVVESGLGPPLIFTEHHCARMLAETRANDG